MSDNRPRLGRGLASLIRNSSQEDNNYQSVSAAPPAPLDGQHDGDGLRLVPLDRIGSNPSQPRRRFDQQLLDQLAQSLKLHGLIEPIVVSELPSTDGKHYQLIAGERRLRAAKLAGLADIPCIVRPSEPKSRLELALVENLHRDDLNPIERASAYRELMDTYGLTQEQVSQRVNQPRTTIANHIRLLDLCNEVQELVIGGALSFGHAKVLAGLAGDTRLQVKLAQRGVSEELSVRQLEEALAQAAGGGPAAPAKAPPTKAPYLGDLERQLCQAVGTKVSIRPGRAKHSGRIVIEYYSLEDFDRIAARLGAAIDS
jgi:ParB family chromosome partitioning protein